MYGLSFITLVANRRAKRTMAEGNILGGGFLFPSAKTKPLHFVIILYTHTEKTALALPT